MRHAHDWGRASGRPHRSAPVSRKWFYARAILSAGIGVLAACDNPGSQATDPGVTASADTRAQESTLSVYEGVAYPRVTIEPSTSVTMSVGERKTFYASLSEPSGEAWTSCCSKYSSSDPSVASVAVSGYGVNAGEHAVVTAHRRGHATITATTESGTKGSLAVDVGDGSDPSGGKGSGSKGSNGSSSGGTSGGGAGASSPNPNASPTSSGGGHEPAGMRMQVNTGAIRSTSVVDMDSPSSQTSVGEWSGNLSVVPGGTGLRITYRPDLAGGYSPVRFGFNVPSAGTGWYYQRMKVRLSPNWSMSGNVDVKLCEPRTHQQGSGSGPVENDVLILQDFNTQGPNAYLAATLQGPYGQARDLFSSPQFSPAANLRGGAWHTIEVLLGPESRPGAGNGSYTAWVDGNEVSHITNVQWLAAGNPVGWPYLMFDPTYGGGIHHPNATMYWDVDQVYVSTK